MQAMSGVGQDNAETGSTVLIGSRNRARHIADSAKADRKPKAGPFSGAFGGKEGLKQLVQNLLWNAAAGIADFDHMALLGGKVSTDRDLALSGSAGLNGIAGIADQIKKNLLEDDLFADHGRLCFGDCQFQCDIQGVQLCAG